LHLRFRLGGDCFPPRLLYKIFTHRPVADICSFCPRNYNAQQTSRSEGGQVATKAPVFSTTRIGWGERGDSASAGWYSREENNQWRQIDGKVFESGLTLSERKPCKPVFHFCSKERVRQRELHRKQLQRKWRLAIYRCAPASAKKLPTGKHGALAALWCKAYRMRNHHGACHLLSQLAGAYHIQSFPYN
jgi:hypothetical protein